jgi:KDO2-lipid IV(A) lauroyltransferase
MQAIIFYSVLPIIYFISILPFWVLYRVSDILYFVVYYVVGYRKQLVLKNLKNSFPEKSERELLKIRKKFYQFFSDIIVESIKIFTMSAKQLEQRCKINDMGLLEMLGAENTDFILVTGHYGNWEWAGSVMGLKTKQIMYALYKPLSNKYFDRLIYNSRVRFRLRLISIKDSSTAIRSQIGKGAAFAFISDQAAKPDNAYWTTFLNQDAPVFWGAELVARKYNLPIIYVSVERVRRGFYEVHLEKLFEQPRGTKRGEITESYTRRLEKDIIANPEIWLWTHNRWKHKRSQKQN